MFEFVKNFFNEEKPEAKDVIFNIMYFVESSIPEIMKNVTSDDDFRTKVLIPFNYLVIPFILGGRVIKSNKLGTTIVFNEYELSEKEIKQVAFLYHKFNETADAFYTTLQSDSQNIQVIPERKKKAIAINPKDLKISDIPGIVLGKDGNEGLINQRLSSSVICKLAENGKEISKAIRFRNTMIWGGSILTLVAIGAGVGYFFYNRGKDENSETTTVVAEDESSDEEIIDAEYTDAPQVSVEE